MSRSLCATSSLVHLEAVDGADGRLLVVAAVERHGAFGRAEQQREETGDDLQPPLAAVDEIAVEDEPAGIEMACHVRIWCRATTNIVELDLEPAELEMTWHIRICYLNYYESP